MPRLRRGVPLLLLLLALAPLPGRAQSVAPALRAERWGEADAAAAQLADPVARKVVLWRRLTTRDVASAGEISAFMASSPDWPLQSVLARRRDEAIAAEPDPAVAAAECARPAPFAVSAAPALLRCADATAAQGDNEAATAFARRAWVAGPGDVAWENQVVTRWGAVLGTAEQRARFERLAWIDTPAATRQAARLDAPAQARAQAWMALRRDAPEAPALVAALPAAERTDPALVLEQGRWLRRAGQDAAALTLWTSAGPAAEATAPRERLAAFWSERNTLARRLLRAGDANGAYALADGFAGPDGETRLDAEFLAGFVALRRLGHPDLAEPHFRALLNLSRAAITQSRAHFWLGRAAQARNDAATARAEFAAAAGFPSTFYGQLAALALGETPEARIRAAFARLPDGDRALDFAGRELVRAAAWLVGWGDSEHAEMFLLRLDDILPDTADRALTAKLAEGFGLAQTAIALSRRAGRDGVALLPTGWPVAASIPANAGVEQALTLAIIRQESSFDTMTVSPAGARGLMQLMPGTATELARKIGLSITLASLTADPRTNIALGTAYLAGLLGRYQGAVPMAVAAYNAGPGRVADWLAGFGDPRAQGDHAPGDHAQGDHAQADMVDWIELIPINETRNYVQRVIENQEIYRAELNADAPHPLAAWVR